jgi:hypothetical protein
VTSSPANEWNDLGGDAIRPFVVEFDGKAAMYVRCQDHPHPKIFSVLRIFSLIYYEFIRSLPI